MISFNYSSYEWSLLMSFFFFPYIYFLLFSVFNIQTNGSLFVIRKALFKDTSVRITLELNSFIILDVRIKFVS